MQFFINVYSIIAILHLGIGSYAHFSHRCGLIPECELTSWKTWSACSDKCGNGFRTRSKDICCIEGVDGHVLENSDCKHWCNITIEETSEYKECSDYSRCFKDMDDPQHPPFIPVRLTDGWSPWINRDDPSRGGGDSEKLSPGELKTFCPGGNATKIECWTIDYGVPSYSSGEIVTCSLDTGLVCHNADNFPIPCSDYKIRYYCHLSVRADVSTVLTKIFRSTENNSSNKPQNKKYLNIVIAVICTISVAGIIIVGVIVAVICKKTKREKMRRQNTSKVEPL